VLTIDRIGDLAKDEVEMKKCWEEIWGVLEKEGKVENRPGSI